MKLQDETFPSVWDAFYSPKDRFLYRKPSPGVPLLSAAESRNPFQFTPKFALSPAYLI